MLNLKELQALLLQNDRLMKLEIARMSGARTKRIIALQLHRTLIKDCIIELFEAKSNIAA